MYYKFYVSYEALATVVHFTVIHQITYRSQLPFHHTTINREKFRFLPQFSIPYYPNNLILIPPLSVGQAGKAWEPSDKMMLFLPPEIKHLSLLHHDFFLLQLF
jgi:hypothetical protein